MKNDMSIKTRILVVDDDEEFTETLRDLLEIEEYTASATFCGDEALDKVKREKFDIVLMDIKMPGMNGIEVLKEIKKIIPCPVVILMTGFTVEDLIQEALDEGAFAVLYKPLDIPQLLQRLEAVRNTPASGVGHD
jgi:CheY-like chemotaxis protein